jgi:hypothetical protein
MNNMELTTKEPGYGLAYNASIVTKYMAYVILKSYETTMEV